MSERQPVPGRDRELRTRRASVSARIAAWAVAVALNRRTALRFVIAFALAHALAWTAILTEIKGAQDVHMDVAEAYAWGQKLLLGYGKHPPLVGWVAAVWFTIFPAADWSTYALAMATIGCSLVICWQIAIRVVDPRRAMISVVMLTIYPIFNFKGFKWNPDLLQLVTLPLVVLAFLRAFERRDFRSGLWLGLAAAAAVMTKYWVLTMIGAIGMAALLHPERMKFLRSPAPWTAVLTFVLAMLPHLWWLQQVDFLPLTYAGDVYGSRSLFVSLHLAVAYLLHNIGLLLLPIVCAAGAIVWNPHWSTSLREHAVVRDLLATARSTFASGRNGRQVTPQVRIIWMTQAIVAIVPPVAAVYFGIYMKTDWGISLFFLVPLALVAIPALSLRLIALVRLLLMWLAGTLVMLMIAPMIATESIGGGGKAGMTFSPRSEFALQLTEAWRARFNTRWAVVAGTTEIGEGMTFYSPDHPLPFTPGELWSSGLTSLEEAQRLGFIGACATDDPVLAECEKWMNDNASQAERLTLTSRRYYHGRSAPTVSWKVWISPPSRS